MTPVKWGVLGVATHFVRRVYLGTRNSSDVEIAAIASRSPGKATESARELGIPNGYGSYEELLADKSIEAVYIPLPNHLHLEWIKKAADAGKHVLCEKPLGMNAQEVEEAIDYTRKKGVILMEAFMYRFHPQWLHVRDLIRIGEIGAVTAVQSTFFYTNKDPANIRNMLETGGGGLMDIGCYAVSSARFVVGHEPKRVVSLVYRDPDMKIDRLTSGILDFGNVQATFTVATQNFPHQHVDIYGTSGTISVDIPFNTPEDVPVKVNLRDSIGARELTFTAQDQYRLEFEAFSRAVRENAEAPTLPEDALANQRVLDALFASERSGNWESL